MTSRGSCGALGQHEVKPKSKTYIDPEWVFPEVLVLNVVKVDWIRVEPAESLLLEPLLELGDAPGGDAEVAEEADQHDGLGVWFTQPVADHVPEESHHSVLLVVFRIERIIFVDTTAAENVVEKSLGNWNSEQLAFSESES